MRCSGLSHPARLPTAPRSASESPGRSALPAVRNVLPNDFAIAASGARSGWMGFIWSFPVPARIASFKRIQELDAHHFPGFHPATLVFQHDVAVRLRHRAQHPGALLSGGSHLPAVAVGIEHAALVFGPARDL